MAPAPPSEARAFPTMSAVRNSNQPPAPPALAPMLVPVGQHQGRPPLPLGRAFTLIGSTASARLYLPSKAVSRCHAAVINTGGGLFVRDLASRTQTRVNGQPIVEADLREGDVLQVGPFTFRFTDPTALAARPPALPAPPAALEVEGLDAPLPLKGRSVLIGRRESADISLTENSASSAHALLLVLEGHHLVRDLGSRTGTLVNGVKVHEQVLDAGDVLRVGETDFRYVPLGRAAASAAKARGPAAPQSAEVRPAAAGSAAAASDNDGGLDLIPLDPPAEDGGLSPSPELGDAKRADDAASDSGLLPPNDRRSGDDDGVSSRGELSATEGEEIDLRPADSPP